MSQSEENYGIQLHAKEEFEEQLETDGDKGNPRSCDVCDIICGNEHAYDLHITGKTHQRALRLRENFDVLTDPDRMKIVDNAPTILESLTAVDEPLIGLNYLIEFVPDEENQSDNAIIWVCVLCGSTLASDGLVKEHFIGKRHRYRYLSKYYPDMSKQVHAKDKNSDKFSLCMSFAKEVEENEGKKFDSIQVAVNPNDSNIRMEGPPAKKKPVSLLDLKLPLMPPSLGRGGPMGFPPLGPGVPPGPFGPVRPPLMNGPGFPPMIPVPRTMAQVIPLLSQIEVHNMADRECLVEASQILEQKLIDFNTFMGLDPYDGVQPCAPPEYDENAYVGETAQIPGTGLTDTNTSATGSNDSPGQHKGPVSLMDLPSPSVRGGWSGRGRSDHGGFQSF